MSAIAHLQTLVSSEMLLPVTDADHRWNLSNPGPEKLAVWLEPWAEEFEIPVRSAITMAWSGGSEESALGELEWTPDHLVVWANVSTIRVFIDGVLQDTSSASIPIPADLTKAMLKIVFAGQPTARLGGAYADANKRKTWWSRLRRRFRPWLE